MHVNHRHFPTNPVRHRGLEVSRLTPAPVDPEWHRGASLILRVGILLLVFAGRNGIGIAADLSHTSPRPAPVILKDPLTIRSDLKSVWTVSGDEALISQGKDGILFNLPESPARANLVLTRPLPVRRCAGKIICVSASIRAEHVASPPNPWNGIKLMVVTTAADGTKAYPQAELSADTFDWREARTLVRVPEGAKALDLTIGFEQVHGKAWFRDLTVTVVPEPTFDERAFAIIMHDPSLRGHSVPRLRGAMVSTNIDEEGLRVLGQEWKCNLIRWQLGMLSYQESGLSLPDYDTVLEKEVAALDKALPLCENYGLYVLVDMHSLAASTFVSVKNQDKLVEVWKTLARKYKDRPVVWGYDLINEPVTQRWNEGVPLWQELAERLCREIRKVDPLKPIIIEPEWGNPAGFSALRPVALPNIIYSVHMYDPGQFTHNRVWDKKQKVETYPGQIDGVHWDKAQIERDLAPVIQFQKKYRVPIYVGEFSAIRWSPGADKYFADLVDIFEKYGWDWTYHAFREFDGWSLEHDEDPAHTTPSLTQTKRLKVLLSWFAKNQKPVFGHQP